MILSLLLCSLAFSSSETVHVGVKEKMKATLYKPDEGKPPFPAVLVLHTSHGLETAELDFAEGLAKKGYIAVVPEFLDYYHISPKDKQESFTNKARDIYDDFAATVGQLKKRGDVGKVGAVGFSNGGYFAAWLAATDQVAGAVGYYGAYSGNATDIELKRFREVFQAKSAPFLILHGEEDSEARTKHAETLDAILKEKQAPHELVLYKGVGHKFERKNMKDEEYKKAREDAWTRTLAFLAKQLR